MPRDITVRELIQRLQTYDADRIVRLATAPDFPFAHYLGALIEGRDDAGLHCVFLGDGGQQSYLPRPVAVALRWTPDTTGQRERRRAVPATSR
ncbi:hypothetical protein ACFY1P_09260 [Streptomyces sp. NPDC001407]|uniref:hypothetical protein n=1 Tax=Streptomyces sp. NPDC001407 TaxID=3364573 RepID=UPI0036C9BCDA